VPELPEVETVRQGLERHVTGRTIATVQVLHPRAVRRHLAGAEEFSAALAGRGFGSGTGNNALRSLGRLCPNRLPQPA